MDEREWLACNEPAGMVGYLRYRRNLLRSKQGRRKARLFGCACCRRIWHLLADQRSQRAIQRAEAFAEGIITQRELDSARQQAANVSLYEKNDNLRNAHGAACAGIFRACATAGEAIWACSEVRVALLWVGGDEKEYAERAIQCGVFRDIFGNPFRPISIDPTRQTPTVISLAQAAYENRILPAGELDAARLVILADALEEAGCTDADILGHLRGPGPHVRGCYVVDLILDKK